MNLLSVPRYLAEQWHHAEARVTSQGAVDLKSLTFALLRLRSLAIVQLLASYSGFGQPDDRNRSLTATTSSSGLSDVTRHLVDLKLSLPENNFSFPTSQ